MTRERTEYDKGGKFVYDDNETLRVIGNMAKCVRRQVQVVRAIISLAAEVTSFS